MIASLWQRLVDEARERREATRRERMSCAAMTRSGAVRAAIENVERARVAWLRPRRASRSGAADARERGVDRLVVTNPPYGERIGDQEQLQALYAIFGAKLREHFEGWKAAVLTGNPPLAKAIGINARRTHTLFNGRIECRLLRFDVSPGTSRERTAAAG